MTQMIEDNDGKMVVDEYAEYTMKMSNTQRCESYYLYVNFKGTYSLDTVIKAAQSGGHLVFITTNGHPLGLQFTGKTYDLDNLDAMPGFQAILQDIDFPEVTLHMSREYDEQFIMWQ